MIVKRLQLSETFGKIMVEVEAMESKLEKAALPQEESEQVFHRKEDLENHIEKLKVSFFLSVLIIFCEFQCRFLLNFRFIAFLVNF